MNSEDCVVQADSLLSEDRRSSVFDNYQKVEYQEDRRKNHQSKRGYYDIYYLGCLTNQIA